MIIKEIIADIKEDPELRREIFEGLVGWSSLFALGFMAFVIGG